MVREALERFSESAREAFETVLVGDRIGRRVVSVRVTLSMFTQASLPWRHSKRLLQFARRHSGT